jgi:hypothetical protein
MWVVLECYGIKMINVTLSYDFKWFRRVLKRFIQSNSFYIFRSVCRPQLVMNDTLFVVIAIPLFVNVCWIIYFTSVSLYFKCIKFYYCILLLKIFLSTLYIYICIYITLCCCVSLIIINMTISISCKKIYGKINDINMNMNMITVLENWPWCFLKNVMTWTPD